MVVDTQTNTEIGVMKAITWLRQMGRPILADKMERELLFSNGQMQGVHQRLSSSESF